ncbi:DNA repair exonuclease [Bacillus sp. Marseille-Q3570]|uniref:metallophosphoesterase family protein n=1 Tax=Bacillus sp. Marseille-Q3570 TaxID=2963522 RepID=UPI0021B7A88B|nr:DNA repair exonuclease [Bacillus sp. Marseille-Q3570]
MWKIRFIHTADLHIDTPFKGLGHLPEAIFNIVKDSTFRSFERLVTLAIEKQVDFLVISGDLYDGANRSLKAQLFLKNQFQRLHDHRIDIFVIHGNHDHLGGKYIKLKWPDNVHFFSSKEPEMLPFEKEGEVHAHLYGYSYPKQAVTENISSKYQKQDGPPFHIALLHGTIGGNTDHQTYAPFILQELQAQPFDYWALGHIHKREELSHHPYVIYPGNIQGLNRKESGPKGCYLVEMNEVDASLEFLETSTVRWESESLSIAKTDMMDDLILQINLVKEKLRTTGMNTILSIELSGESPALKSLNENDILDDLMDHLHEGEDTEEPFVWVNRLAVEPVYTEYINELGESHFMKEIFNVFEQMDKSDPVLDTLLKHKKAKKFLDDVSLEDREIVEEAKRLLIESIALQSER